MTTKNVLVTGATGGIGGDIVRELLLHGYKVYAPVRDLKVAEEKCADFPNRHNLILEQCNIENITESRNYIQKLKKTGVVFFMLFLAAGTLVYDFESIKLDPPIADKKERMKVQKELFIKMSESERLPFIEESKRVNYIANAVTKENVIIPFLDFYHDEAKETLLELIGSQASKFPIGHVWRFTEEGYCYSHSGVDDIEVDYGPKFKGCHVERPPLIDTPMTREKFALNDDGTPRDFSQVIKPNEYNAKYLKEIGLI